MSRKATEHAREGDDAALRSCRSTKSEKKRMRSQGNDTATNIGYQSKKVKAQIPKRGKNPSNPKPEKSLTDHVRQWLTEASNNELDLLWGWLSKRKDDFKSRSGEAKGPALQKTMETQPDTQENENQRMLPVPEHSPKICRRISTRSLAEMEAFLFPEDHSRPSLSDRFDKPEATI